MDSEKIEKLVTKRLSKKRAKHVFLVRDTAVVLAKRHGVSVDEVATAALLHDITKEEPKDRQLQTLLKSDIILNEITLKSPQLFHAMTGSLYAKEILGIDHPEILMAIRYHTTGRAGMSEVEKVVYIADAISADRNYKGVEEFRRLAVQSLDGAMLALLQHTLRYLIKGGALIPYDTMAAYNEYAKKLSKTQG